MKKQSIKSDIKEKNNPELAPDNKPIKIKTLYKEIGVSKLLNLKYAGFYRDYSEYVSPYVFVFYDVKTEKKINIGSNKITEWSWKFKEGYIYEIGFNEVGEMVSLRNKDKYLCYFKKPNKIYLIEFEMGIRKWVNKPISIQQPVVEYITYKL